MAKPEWHPLNAGKEFATNILAGVKNSDIDLSIENNMKRQDHSIAEMKNAIINGDRVMLSKAITLIESNSEKHFEKAQNLLSEILPYSGNSIRIGITGSPGVGKSTVIESIGSKLCNEDHNVAVLAVDPSSSRTKGSILGDKTRMEMLSRNENAFIRPSPSSGFLGGVSRKTRETILLCEAAGFDIILIETVGVGQSEITVRSMVDLFLLLILPGGGDELQGIKKGVVELADIIMINKADGDNRNAANITKKDYEIALHYLRNATDDWNTKVMTSSALNNEGIDELWKMTLQFIEHTKKNDIFDKRRKEQLMDWLDSMLRAELSNKFFSNEGVINDLKNYKKQIMDDKITPTRIVKELISTHIKII